MSTLFFNRLPHSLCLSIEDDPQKGTYSFVSDRNDSSDGMVCVQYTKSTVEATDDLLTLLSGKFAGRKFRFVAKGTVEFSDEIRQTGSAWDAEETVCGSSHNWTKSGIVCVIVSFDENGRLVRIGYDTEYPFVNPEGSDSGPSFPGIAYEINPWGYPIHRVGEKVWIGTKIGRSIKHVCHKVKSVDQEPLYMTPEKDIPVYETACGDHVGNSAPNASYWSYFPEYDDWMKWPVGLCPICFPLD